MAPQQGRDQNRLTPDPIGESADRSGYEKLSGRERRTDDTNHETGCAEPITGERSENRNRHTKSDQIDDHGGPENEKPLGERLT